mmetsp:Transcript_13037/g.29763  ORF Transcript_13037/g.29763 Transcript_13037/m.29763 type:complete len:97 (-) Transcript_13037:114-404(-)
MHSSRILDVSEVPVMNLWWICGRAPGEHTSQQGGKRRALSLRDEEQPGGAARGCSQGIVFAYSNDPTRRETERFYGSQPLSQRPAGTHRMVSIHFK